MLTDQLAAHDLTDTKAMATRPAFIDLNLRSNSAAGAQKLGLPSPRIQHFDGERPPSLSPLDAFAAQSRKLAMELEQAKKNAPRRLSRLPPALVQKSLSDHQSDRPRYFRTLSEEKSPQEQGNAGTAPVMMDPYDRPVSSYPFFGGLQTGRNGTEESDTFVTPMEHPDVTRIPRPTTPLDYFGAPRAESPEQSSAKSVTFNEEVKTRTGDSQDSNTKRLSTTGSTTSHPDLTFTLAPPNAAFARTNNRTPREGSDDDYASSAGGSTFSHARKPSSSSGVSTPQSPKSPLNSTHGRSGSQTSEQSSGGTRRSRSNLNFSRPLSSTSLNKQMQARSPSRQQSNASNIGRPYLDVADYLPPRPSFDDSSSVKPDGFMSESGPSYTYTKWSLPRGREPSRNSKIFQGLSTPHFEWQEPMFPGTPPIGAISDYSLAMPSPPPTLGRPSTSLSETRQPASPGFSFEFSSRSKTPEPPASSSNPFAYYKVPKSPVRLRTPSLPESPTSARPRPSTTSRPSVESGEPSVFRLPPAITADEDNKSLSTESNSTVRPHTSRSKTTVSQPSADEHVSKGIECHERGDVKESTYHLRIAARENHPTGMLLYALACRHGWGMRANPEEGVQWLRKAMDSAMLEVADDESAESTSRDIAERKTRKAQFALSIYELGVSHLNGWGVEQDKALALRCFEIAGSWGDADALTEAGFCYAEGIGCKKDLKKAAKFYRTAEAKGISMVGNSW